MTELSEKELKEIFQAIDKDNSSTLTLCEVILFLKSITDDLSEKNIERIFNGIDSSGDRQIDFREFKDMMKKITESGWKKSDGENIKEEDIRALFDMIDTDRSGSLSKREAKKAAKLIRDRFGFDEIEDWIEKVDYDNDGILTYEEFKFSLAGNIDMKDL